MADLKHGIIAWLTHVRLSRIILLLLLVFIIAPLIAHHYLSKFAVESYEDTHKSRTKLDHPDELRNIKSSDLKYHVDELKRIKASVNNELRELESKRQKLHAEIAGYNSHIDKLKNEYEKTTKYLHMLRLSVENTKLEKEDIIKNNRPILGSPVRILPQLKDENDFPAPKSWHRCRMGTCFDLSICSLTSGFPVYFYNPERHAVTVTQVESFIKVSVTYAFDATPYRTLDPHIACLFVVLVGDTGKAIEDRELFEKKLHGLPYWHGDGRNHVLVNLARDVGNTDIFFGVNTGRAIVAQSTFLDTQFRSGFDIILPPALGVSHGDTWDQLLPLLPVHRKHLLSFLGENRVLEQTFPMEEYSPIIGKSVTLVHPSADEILARDDSRSSLSSAPQKRSLLGISSADTDAASKRHNEAMQLLTVEHVLVEQLRQMQRTYSIDNFHFRFRCESEHVHGLNGEWDLCGPASSREEIIRESTFCLIIAPTNYSVISTTITQFRIFEALKFGCVPVILGDSVNFPFSELLSWKRSSVTLPKGRISELHFYIRSFTDNDIVAMKWQGRIFFEKYFGSTQSIVETLLATIRTRLNIPPAPMREEPSPTVFNGTFVPLKDEDVEPQAETEDMLGPIEPAMASPKFLRNFTFSPGLFNQPGDPFHLYPFTPDAPVLPSEAKFQGSGAGFRPIGRGAGGSGREFNEALGGNYPREQFTIVMLTYEREAVLINALQRLKGLPHLNKVVVVWNSPKPPSEDLRWPDIGVRIHVLRTAKNSLNNRFLPYDAIETEAILSIDDDAHLRHDEIMFGFRVWRESRERIVGFPGRYHAWDLNQKNWLYNSNYSCELSMVLTGAAFFHKYYSYLYSYVMPQAIRDKVDEYINCEDLAMNFLVSHITRKPPVKVTSRWTFRCPGCPKALSVEDTHFNERHKCINFFTRVYGYNPLLYTQFRVDSVLFKTRIPHDKQKCFKFI